jgi:bifunctional UDP-N-acetylglucosamine pyrophosphorylase/glucosamine-1-phosphate N-acetyltransferase
LAHKLLETMGDSTTDTPRMTNIAIILLAAGQGTRMRSSLPKVLHKAGGRTLLGHVLVSAAELAPKRTVVVLGPAMEAAAADAHRFIPDATVAIQEKRQGTGHAVSMAIPALAGFTGIVVVLYGDVPLIAPETVKALAGSIGTYTPLAVLAFKAADPTGYGRLILQSGRLSAIREELDATTAERKIDLCNSGFIAADADLLRRLLPRIRNDNAKGEYYLTDLVELAVEEKIAVAHTVCDEQEVHGVNTRAQLAEVEGLLQNRYRRVAMEQGATLVAPETVFFSADTKLGSDVVIEPNVVFGPGVVVGDSVAIHAFSHIEGATIARGARIGPFARLRPGADIGEDVHIGNFVEVKKAKIEKGAKANHLAYIGDARVGAKSNIGAGAITCNYDGFEKHLTDIGEDVFVGSNAALVAPVKIGDRVNIAAGSVITRDVPADAFAIGRGRQEVREGRATTYRTMKKKRAKKE